MSYGKAVISTKCDGPVEILNTNKKNGILVSMKKPSEMSDAIISLIKDSNLHKECVIQIATDNSKLNDEGGLFVSKGSKNLN